jgi:hypothetical protein
VYSPYPKLAGNRGDYQLRNPLSLDAHSQRVHALAVRVLPSSSSNTATQTRPNASERWQTVHVWSGGSPNGLLLAHTGQVGVCMCTQAVVRRAVVVLFLLLCFVLLVGWLVSCFPSVVGVQWILCVCVCVCVSISLCVS